MEADDFQISRVADDRCYIQAEQSVNASVYSYGGR